MAASSFIGPEFVSLDVLHKNQAAGWRDQHPAARHDRLGTTAVRDFLRNKPPREFVAARSATSQGEDSPAGKLVQDPDVSGGIRSGRGGDCSQLWRENAPHW